MRNKKKNKYMLLLILLLGITLGYAAISTTLKITGQATVTKQSWDVYWGVPTVSEGSVTTTAPTRTEDSGDPANTKLTWNITLDLPGDYYEFTVDAVNNGTVDAMITGLTPSVSPALPTNPEYIKYEVTYADGVTPALNHILPKKEGNTPTTETYKVRVYYDETVATAASINGMSDDTTYTFNLELTYGQATDEAIEPRLSWNLPNGRTKDTLQVGDEICAGEECFNFIKYDGNDVVMLAKYNLKVGNIYEKNITEKKIGEYTSSDPGYNKQSSEVRGWVDGATTWSGTVKFSKTNYWYDSVTDAIKPEYGSARHASNIYDATNYKGAPGTNNYSIAYYVEEYKNILTAEGVTIKTARLLTYPEAKDSSIGCTSESCPTTGNSAFITNTSFWLGTAYSGGDYEWVWGIFLYGSNPSPDWQTYSSETYYGVRPVIVVEKSNL